MMTNHEQRMCEMQGEFFELSIHNFDCSSFLFISRFMNSEIAKDLDEVDNPYNFISPNNLISLMRMNYPSITKENGEKISEKVMKWIGYIYRAYSIIKKRSSSTIYKSLKAEKMVSLFDSYHTMSPEYCVDRLEEIVNQNNMSLVSDYEIFKKIYDSK